MWIAPQIGSTDLRTPFHTSRETRSPEKYTCSRLRVCQANGSVVSILDTETMITGFPTWRELSFLVRHSKSWIEVLSLSLLNLDNFQSQENELIFSVSRLRAIDCFRRNSSKARSGILSWLHRKPSAFLYRVNVI